MKVYALPNLRSLDVEVIDPTTINHPGYPGADKKEFSEWCSNEATKHCFYSMAEGVTPSQRITVNNEAHLLHGLVIDYVTKIKDGDIERIPERGAAWLLPTWTSTTFS